jgi:hypothetical protein
MLKILLSVLLFFRKQSFLSLHMSLEIFIAAVGHDLLMGLNSGNVYSVSLRQQLQDPGGEDDLVQVWSMEDRVVVAWVENYISWVNDCCIRFMLDFT